MTAIDHSKGVGPNSCALMPAHNALVTAVGKVIACTIAARSITKAEPEGHLLQALCQGRTPSYSGGTGSLCFHSFHRKRNRGVQNCLGENPEVMSCDMMSHEIVMLLPQEPLGKCVMSLIAVTVVK